LVGGSYEIIAIDESECSVEIEVEIVDPDPLTIEVLDADLNEGYITVNANGGTQPYRYTIDDKATYQDGSTFTELEIKEYTISVIDANDCEATVFYIFENVEDFEFTELKIYPNPTIDILYVESVDLSLDVEIIVFGNTGHFLYHLSKGDYSLTSNAIEVPLGRINSGSYILKLSDQNKTSYRRFVVIR
jgi:hypothetical protein